VELAFTQTPINMLWVVALALIDGVVHYFIDWAKINVSKVHKVSEQVFDDNGKLKGVLITSDWYFYYLIADQCAHFATYALLVYFL